jgi:hypothetical protein
MEGQALALFADVAHNPFDGQLSGLDTGSAGGWATSSGRAGGSGFSK